MGGYTPGGYAPGGYTSGITIPAKFVSDKFRKFAETKPAAWLNHDFWSGIEETEFVVSE